jgi:hypothetical protein
VKKLLKVALYTSLNGGNPSGPERMLDNIALNLGSYLHKKNISGKTEEIKTDPIWDALGKVMEDCLLIKEVKDLNMECVYHDGDKIFSFTVDRVIPYETDSDHKGISRVLQGFEVVLLSVLARDVLAMGGLPVSLDHDGLLMMFPTSKFNQLFDGKAELLAEALNSREFLFSPWSEYLLRKPVPLEVKRLITKSQIIEF